MKPIVIQRESPATIAGIHQVEELAFERPGEADLVDAIRAQGGILLSLVAVQERQVVGHGLFTPMTLDPDKPGVKIAGLGPVAVHPQFQRQGIGGLLIEAGLEELRQQGIDAVFVLGGPDYYTRFGFVSNPNAAIRCKYPVGPQYFMSLEIKPGCLAGYTGTALYLPEFDKV